MRQNTKNLKTIADELLVPEISYECSQQQYTQWATDGTYDTMIKDEKNYTAPRRLTEKMVELFPDKESRTSGVVLDLGAGSGIIGEWLLKEDFKHLHGMEPVSEFVEIAASKDVYEKIYQEKIGDGDVLDVDNDSYDAIVAAGAYGPGHIPADSFHEVIRLLKPGGYFINCMRHSYLWTTSLYTDTLEPLCQQLEQDGKWKRIEWETYPNHFLGHEGLRMIFKKC